MNNRDDSEDDLPPPVAFNMWGGSEVVNNSNRAVSVPEGEMLFYLFIITVMSRAFIQSGWNVPIEQQQWPTGVPNNSDKVMIFGHLTDRPKPFGQGVFSQPSSHSPFGQPIVFGQGGITKPDSGEFQRKQPLERINELERGDAASDEEQKKLTLELQSEKASMNLGSSFGKDPSNLLFQAGANQFVFGNQGQGTSGTKSGFVFGENIAGSSSQGGPNRVIWGKQDQENPVNKRNEKRVRKNLKRSTNDLTEPNEVGPKQRQFGKEKGGSSSILIPNTDQRETDARRQRAERFKLDPAAPAENKSPEHRKSSPSTNGMEDKSQISAVVYGECLDMCPESERIERQEADNLHSMECEENTNRTNPGLAVKQYIRNQPRKAELLRTLPTLKRTMNYLIGLLRVPFESPNLLEIYSFLWDRMRSIRTDMRMQRFENEEAVEMLEQMIRFHIMMMHELCDAPLAVGGFDPHMNVDHLNKIFGDLMPIYKKLKSDGRPQPNEGEFRAYYIMLKLDNHTGFQLPRGSSSVDLMSIPPDLLQTDEIAFVYELFRKYAVGNVVAFFRLFHKANYLQACILQALFFAVRTKVLESVQKCMSKQEKYPFPDLAERLSIEPERLKPFLKHHGVTEFAMEDSVECMMKQSAFRINKKPMDGWKSQFTIGKRGTGTLGDEIIRKPGFVFKHGIMFGYFGQIGLSSVNSIVGSREKMVQERIQAQKQAQHLAQMQAQAQAQAQAEHQRKINLIEQKQKELDRKRFEEARAAQEAQRKAAEARQRAWEEAKRKREEKEAFERTERERRAKAEREMQERKEREERERKAREDRERREREEREQREREKKERIERERIEAERALMDLATSLDPLKGEKLGKELSRAYRSIAIKKLRGFRTMLYTRARDWETLDIIRREYLSLSKRKFPALLNFTSLTEGPVNTDMSQSSILDTYKEDPAFEKLNLGKILMDSISSDNTSRSVLWKMAVCSRMHDWFHVENNEDHRNGDIFLAEWLYRTLGFKGNPTELNKPQFSCLISEEIEEWEGINNGKYIVSHQVVDLGFDDQRLAEPEKLEGSSGVVFVLNNDEPLSDEVNRLKSLTDGLSSATPVPLLIVWATEANTGERPVPEPFQPNWSLSDVSDSSWQSTMNVIVNAFLSSTDRSKYCAWSGLVLMDHYSSGHFSEIYGSVYNSGSGREMLQLAMDWMAQKRPLNPSQGLFPTSQIAFFPQFSARKEGWNHLFIGFNNGAKDGGKRKREEVKFSLLDSEETIQKDKWSIY